MNTVKAVTGPLRSLSLHHTSVVAARPKSSEASASSSMTQASPSCAVSPANAGIAVIVRAGGIIPPQHDATPQEEPVARLQRKDLANPDEVRDFPGGSRVEIFQLEDVVVGRTVWLPGWRWSKVVKEIAGTELCEYHHLGYSISGRFRVAMPDGTEMEIRPTTSTRSPPATTPGLSATSPGSRSIGPACAPSPGRWRGAASGS